MITVASKQAVEITIKGRQIGSRIRTITRSVYREEGEHYAFVNYEGKKVRVMKLGNDGIDWVGVVNR